MKRPTESSILPTQLARSGVGVHGLPLKAPKGQTRPAGTGDGKGESVKTKLSLYRQRGKPERAMAEIRREILRKIRVQMEREQLLAALTKNQAATSEPNRG
jgi:hypothetical protein